MRLITIPIIIIILFCLLAIFTPVLLLQATEPLDQYVGSIPEIRYTTAEVLADISSFLTKYGTSIEIYDYLIGKKPDNEEYYWEKSNNFLILGKPDDALVALEGAIALDKGNPEYLYKKAVILRSLKRITESNKIYDEIDLLSPGNAKEQVICGDAALDRSNYLKAYENYSEAVRLNPSDSRTWEKRGDVIFSLLTIYTSGEQADDSFKKIDLYSEGITSYENVIKLDPSRTLVIKEKMEKRSDVYTPRTIAELESRYTTYRFLN
ncbi:MAG: hypothetical protein GXY48_14220 [Methanomicrobiales archaeon]|nr:hypothetical protein [Methanomicrobiales archaeon]